MIFLLIVPCVLCFVYAWRRRQKYLEGRLPPVAKGAWPVFGHLHLWIRGHFWWQLLEMQKDTLERGCVTYLYSGTNRAYTYYAFSDPKDCENVVNMSNQKAFLDGGSIRALFGEGLSAISTVWKNNRQLLEAIFEGLCNSEATNRQSRMFVDRIIDKAGSRPFDQTDFLKQTVMKIMFDNFFGLNEGKDCLIIKIETYRDAMEKLSDILFERHQSLLMHKKLFFNCSRLKRIQDECVNNIKGITAEIIAAKKDELKVTGDQIVENTGAKSLLEELLRLESQGYSEQQVSDEVNCMMFEGYESMVNTLTFVLVMLGSHSEVQEKVYLEIENAFHMEKDVDMEDLAKLEYLHAIIMETLRLHPAVTTISRVLTAPIEIKKYSIDPGAQCLLFIHAMNRHPSWGSDVEAFRPDRWLDRSLLPNPASFGLGRLSCTGMKLAMTIMKTILVHLVRKYKIISDHTKMAVAQRLLLTPVSGHHIALERRIYIENRTEPKGEFK